MKPLELCYTDLPKTLVRGWRRQATDWEKTFANHISDRTIKNSQNSAIRKSKFKMVTDLVTSPKKIHRWQIST